METHLKIASAVANLLDNSFEIFGRRFGINGLLGLIPGLGDLIPALLSFYLVWVGTKMNLPKTEIARMMGNIMFNFFVGLIPLVGDYVDFFNHANLKNLAILRKYSQNKIIDGEIIEPPNLTSKRNNITVK